MRAPKHACVCFVLLLIRLLKIKNSKSISGKHASRYFLRSKGSDKAVDEWKTKEYLCSDHSYLLGGKCLREQVKGKGRFPTKSLTSECYPGNSTMTYLANVKRTTVLRALPQCHSQNSGQTELCPFVSFYPNALREKNDDSKAFNCPV